MTRLGLAGRFMFGLLRIQRTPATIVPALSGYYIAGNSDLTLFTLLALTVLCLHISGSIFNDIADFNTDKINYPDRLIVSGIITKRQALVLSLAFISCALLFAVMIDWLFFILVATLGLILEISYSFGVRLKDRPLGSALYLSLGTATIPFLGGFIITRNLNLTAIILALFLAIFTSSSIVGSLKDVYGDNQANKRTIAVALGEVKAKQIINIVVLIPICLYPLIWKPFGFSETYLIYASIPIAIRLLITYTILKPRALENILGRSRLDAPRILNRILIVVEFLILSLAKPSSGLPWL